jgi:hypothetical protein
MASSPESVGAFWLGQFPKCVKQRDFDRYEAAIAVRLSGGDFDLVVETLHNAR